MMCQFNSLKPAASKMLAESRMRMTTQTGNLAWDLCANVFINSSWCALQNLTSQFAAVFKYYKNLNDYLCQLFMLVDLLAASLFKYTFSMYLRPF